MNEPGLYVNVLAVSPYESDLTVLANVISHSAWMHQSARNLKEARAALTTESVQVVLCEAELPDGDWKMLLDFVSELPAPPEMIVISRHADERLWGTVLNLGAWDVLTKPFYPKEIYQTIHQAYRHWSDTSRLRRGADIKSETPATMSFPTKVFAAGA